MILAMIIFSSIGIVRKYIPYESSLIALVRGIIGAVFLILLVRGRKIPLNKQAIKDNLPLLILSGTAIGFNWILLFEAYNYTSVATATLCYYLAPIFVIIFSPFVLKEKISVKNLICTVLALVGIILVSGVLVPSAEYNPSNLTGILLGLAAAVLYACVILMNKRMKPIPAYEKAILQLSAASAALLPYVLLTNTFRNLSFDAAAILLLLAAGIVHTGIAYTLYFSSMEKLKSHTIALLSYIDPVLAVVLSTVVLKEPMSLSSVIGAMLILGSSFVSE